jgi:redox-sensitive bicupin YhaK (pirin superfamily)
MNDLNPMPADVQAVIAPQVRDLGGGFEVRRALPSAERRMIGPFVFWDEFGPAFFGPGQGLDVRPHPHINLATITYLFEGEILHRDSLGSVESIEAGAVNLMVAGRGIVHSERTGPAVRAAGSRLAGIQSWIALPESDEEVAPAFHHHAEAELPLIEDGGVRARLIMGRLFGETSPVKTFSDMFYADVSCAAGAKVHVSAEHEERGAYLVSGEVEIDGREFTGGRLIVFKPGAEIVVAGKTDARFLLLGGAPLGPRHVWWNFVSSRRERIEQAKEDWRAGRFGTVPGDAQDFIPLPEH